MTVPPPPRLPLGRCVCDVVCGQIVASQHTNPICRLLGALDRAGAFAARVVRAWRLYTRLHYSWRLAWVNSDGRGF